MKVENRRELEELVEGIRALIVRLKSHDQPLATQLLEMAVLDIKSRMHGIGDEEFQALVDSLSGEASRSEDAGLVEFSAPEKAPARPLPSGRVVALREVRRGKSKRRS